MSAVEQPLITKYRPEAWDEVVGHDETLEALQRAMRGTAAPHAYLFSGAAGIGKTTLARLVAKEFKCDLVELSGAVSSSVDNARELVELGSHMSLGSLGRRLFLIDECQRLSRGAWDALLKILEEPPPHLYFAFCTTERNKVPPAIVSRCYSVSLRSLKPTDIGFILSAVAEAEGYDVRPGVLTTVIQAANGSPRLAISILQAVNGCEDEEEVARIIHLQGTDDDPAMRIAKLLAGRKTTEQSWPLYQEILAEMQPDDYDGAVEQIAGYITSCVSKAKKYQDAKFYWQVLDAFTFPLNSYSKRAEFMARLGRVLWG